MCQETKQQKVEERIPDTWSGMLWEDFITIATEQGFQIAYQKVVSDRISGEEMEAILYRPDGLILYATSFHETLNKAMIEGEMGAEAFALVKQRGPRIHVYRHNEGPYTDRKSVV